ncbi:hypothetical protein [Bacillus cereus]|nr:hypothetical protein [Bacillus cereus]
MHQNPRWRPVEEAKSRSVMIHRLTGNQIQTRLKNQAMRKKDNV